MIDIMRLYKALNELSEKIDGPIVLSFTVNEEVFFDKVDFAVTLTWMECGVPIGSTFRPEMAQIIKNDDANFLQEGFMDLLKAGNSWADNNCQRDP